MFVCQTKGALNRFDYAVDAKLVANHKMYGLRRVHTLNLDTGWWHITEQSNAMYQCLRSICIEHLSFQMDGAKPCLDSNSKTPTYIWHAARKCMNLNKNLIHFRTSLHFFATLGSNFINKHILTLNVLKDHHYSSPGRYNFDYDMATYHFERVEVFQLHISSALTVCAETFFPQLHRMMPSLRLVYLYVEDVKLLVTLATEACDLPYGVVFLID
jgi:hypothetical protein